MKLEPTSLQNLLNENAPSGLWLMIFNKLFMNETLSEETLDDTKLGRYQFFDNLFVNITFKNIDFLKLSSTMRVFGTVSLRTLIYYVHSLLHAPLIIVNLINRI